MILAQLGMEACRAIILSSGRAQMEFLNDTGYADSLEAMANKSHPEREMYLEWLGGEVGPEAFDLAEINEVLQEM